MLMIRFGKIALVATLVLPAVAQAQRPGATMQTRSAELYLAQAAKTQVPADKAKALKQAQDAALQGVEKNPENSKTWFTLGIVYAQQGDAVGADSAFDKAEQMWPEYTKETEQERYRAFAAAFNAGVVAMQARKVPEAIADLEAAARVYDKSPTAALNLGSLYVQTNQLDKAQTWYANALKIIREGDNSKLNENQKKQYAQWEEQAAFQLANIYANAGKDEDAAKAYQDVLTRFPGNALAKSNLALVYSRMGKTAEATAIYKELLAGDMTADEYFQVGLQMYRAKQYATAAEAFNKATAKNTVFRDAYYNSAQAVYSQIVDAEAAAPSSTATKKAPNAALKAQYDQLREVAEKLYALDPYNRTSIKLLASSYRGLQENSTAAEATQWQNKLKDLIGKLEVLPVEITDLAMQDANDETTISGKLINVAAPQGAKIPVKLEVLKADGTVLVTADVTVDAPDVEAEQEFSVKLPTPKEAAGVRYTVDYVKPKAPAKK
jgi:tetratricopeptide (TPR) repeat protein